MSVMRSMLVCSHWMEAEIRKKAEHYKKAKMGPVHTEERFLRNISNWSTLLSLGIENLA